MRTACLVIVTLLFSIAPPGYPQDSAASPGGGASAGSLDQEITVTGADETALPVPPPGLPGPLVIPDLDLQKPPSPERAPVEPPAGAWAPLPSEWRVSDPVHEG